MVAISIVYKILILTEYIAKRPFSRITNFNWSKIL